MDISVIIPIYNEKKFIDNLMNDLLGNINYIDDRELDIEFLLIDGGSDDGTLEKINNYIKKDNRIKIFHNKMTFQVYAMNIGIKMAKADIIIRCDAHSVYPSNYISKLVYKAYECESEEEARELVKTLPEKGKWPVYFFNSDTIGEKDFKEFYTGEEIIDWDRFENIGVIKNEPIFDGDKLDYFSWKIERLK
jgi:glycosyltransferase involved in cell wall biosynthesis